MDIAGIPYVKKGAQKLLERATAKDCLAYLRLALNTSSDLDFERILNKPKRLIGKCTPLVPMCQCGRCVLHLMTHEAMVTRCQTAQCHCCWVHAPMMWK